jgi:hypothetical protein
VDDSELAGSAERIATRERAKPANWPAVRHRPTLISRVPTHREEDVNADCLSDGRSSDARTAGLDRLPISRVPTWRKPGEREEAPITCWLPRLQRLQDSRDSRVSLIVGEGRPDVSCLRTDVGLNVARMRISRVPTWLPPNAAADLVPVDLGAPPTSL